jgi:trk system potassium uptake protein TrkA
MVTISGVLKNLRRGNMRGIHSIRDSGVEIIEALVTEECSITNIPIEEIKLQSNIKILTIYSHDQKKVIFPTEKTVVKPNDSIIILAYNAKQEEIEKLFSFSVNLF